MTTKHALSILLAALTLAGCSAGEGTAPPKTGNRYIVETANGSPPPAIIATWNTGGTTLVDTGSVYLTGDTLTVDPDGTYRESAWLEGRSGTLLLGRQRWGDNGIWTRTGDTLHFESNYIEDVAFDATVPAPGTLATSRDLRGEGTADYVFRRR